MPKIDVNGQLFNYEVRGEGPAVVIISGLTQNLIPWTVYQTSALEKEGYKVIVFDNRDVGKTGESVLASYTTETMADDTFAIMQAANIDQAHVLGFSMGGMVAMELAHKYPEQVRTLSLLGTAAKLSVYEHNLLAMLEQAKLQFSDEDFWRALSLQAMTWRMFETEAGVDRLLGLLTSEAFYQSPQSLQRQIEACRHFNFSDKVGQIVHATHIMAGAEDKMVLPRHSKLLAEQIKGSKLTVFPDTGHSVYAESANMLNKALLEYWQEH